MALLDKEVLATIDLAAKNEALGLCSFIADALAAHVPDRLTRTAVYVQDEEGDNFGKAHLERVPMGDGSFVYNLVLTRTLPRATLPDRHRPSP
jgi:hypothetical protein